MADLVLDTTYLLPIFGVGIRLKRFQTVFPKLLEEYRVLYNPVSIVEAKWIVLSLARREPNKRLKLLKRFRKGLNANPDRREVWTDGAHKPRDRGLGRHPAHRVGCGRLLRQADIRDGRLRKGCAPHGG